MTVAAARIGRPDDFSRGAAGGADKNDRFDKSFKDGEQDRAARETKNSDCRQAPHLFDQAVLQSLRDGFRF